MNCYSIFASYFPTDYWRSCLALSPGGFTLDFKWWASSKDFFGRKIWQVFLGRDFFGYSKQSEDLLLCSSANKIQPIANLGSQICCGIFGGVDIWSSDFLGFLFLPPFNHPHHLKSGAPPGALWVKQGRRGIMCVRWGRRKIKRLVMCSTWNAPFASLGP